MRVEWQAVQPYVASPFIGARMRVLQLVDVVQLAYIVVWLVGWYDDESSRNAGWYAERESEERWLDCGKYIAAWDLC